MDVMQIGRPTVRTLAVAGLAFSLILLNASVASAGFFDDLFGNHRQESPVASVAALPYAATGTPAPSVTQPHQPSVPSVNYGSVTYCVRLCDGRYFPLQRHAGATPVQMCNSFCPAAKTQVFSGSPIDHAVASNGARYADLDNAFVYRKSIVPGCTCNGRDSFGLAHVDVAQDTTLRAGDIVVTAAGPERFNGSHTELRKGKGFTPVQLDTAAGEPRRVATTGAARAN
jgi:hypothetical protein